MSKSFKSLLDEGKFYAVPYSKVLEYFHTSKNGLSEKEANFRLKKFGYNILEKKKHDSALKIFLSQFSNFLVILLIIATIISFILGEVLDAIAMLSILLLTAILGFVQDYKAEKAMEALEKMSSPYAKVLRNNVIVKIPSKNIVVGDIVFLESGDIVPADGRIIDAHNFKVNEASLTGESNDVKKTVDVIKKNNVPVSEQKNMVFSSTVVTYGKAFFVVTSTGMDTEIGKIAVNIQEQKDTKTPLQKKFDVMGKQISFAALFLIAVVFIISLYNAPSNVTLEEYFFEMLVLSLSLAVAAVPSSLPAIITISLSLGAKNLAKKNMLIKKLPAAESLGSVTYICTDKTGTLTKNEMTVKKIFFDNKIISVSGSGYDVEGEFFLEKDFSSNKKFKNKIFNNESLELLFRIAYFNNNSKLVKNSVSDSFEVIGDPTEGALKVLSYKGFFKKKYFDENFVFIEELPFDSDRKRMSVVYDNLINNTREVYVKGAPDLLLEKCNKIFVNGKIRRITLEDKKRILKVNEEFASNALRVLGFAFKIVDKNFKDFDVDSVEKDLVFVSLVGMIDPPRKEVKDAIVKTQNAGIKVMIITGDHALTTKAVAKEIGLYEHGDKILTGEELDSLSDEELFNIIEDIKIVARALPIQKLRIVNALQKKDHIVAMTVDGVNDAPALKKADVGIAMSSGSDIAKEVSKAVLEDDNFATIVNAISEGRNMYDKIINSTRYLLACNSGEIFTIFTAIILQYSVIPLLPIQILLMNLITDGLPALALGAEPKDKDIMSRPPRDPKENPITKDTLFIILMFGFFMAFGTLFLFHKYLPLGVDYARTIAYTTLVMFEMFAVFGVRSVKPFYKLNPFSNIWLFLAVVFSIVLQLFIIYNPFLQSIFHTTSISFYDWFFIILISSFGFFGMELGKFFIKDEKYKNVKKNKK